MPLGQIPTLINLTNIFNLLLFNKYIVRLLCQKKQTQGDIYGNKCKEISKIL